jgi:hypothetical protein
MAPLHDGPAAPLTAASPYLSIVVTSRNDDHGGNLLRRMQIFVDGLLGQCQRHGLDAELILVEWNPPPGRPRLAQALRWPSDLTPGRVRIIEVPPARHRRFRHSEVLPLFQMIAKNAGIRRARGRFVLATNVDILFSDELVRFLASRALDPARMYRLDRHDVMPDVPFPAGIDEQLAYCRTHLLRINRRDRTHAVHPDGRRIPPPLFRRVVRLALRIAGLAGPGALRRLKLAVGCWNPAAWLIRLHTNGCGDFTLLSREKWNEVRGYLELEMFSFHLDSILCYAAHYSGASETLLADPMRIYHIEHATGSGWTPEGEGQLFARLAADKVPRLSDSMVVAWALQMQTEAPVVFNRDDWGLAPEEFPETCPTVSAGSDDEVISKRPSPSAPSGVAGVGGGSR